MEDYKVLEEIEDAILEENKEEVKADLTQPNNEVYPAYLDTNIISLPLSNYLALYDANKELNTHLNNLVELIIKNTDLNYNKDGLLIDRYGSEAITKYVKTVATLQYVERYEELVAEED